MVTFDGDMMAHADPGILDLLIGTVVLRPYVFIFLLVYLVASTFQFGLKRTLAFTVVGYALVFTAEFSSTRIGFPFGFYYYLDHTRQQELWISNVPFMDSLSFTFLAFASYTTALFLCAPLWRAKGDIQVIDSRTIRRSPSVFVLAVMLFVLIDVIIDPLALRGSRWFLGQIYGYYEEGIYFGVPLANFLGWGIVGAALIICHRRLDGTFQRHPANHPGWGIYWVPLRGLLGPLLYLGVYTFNVCMTFHIKEYLLGIVDLCLLLPLLVLAIIEVSRPANRATSADLEAHLRDFPHSPLAFLQHQMGTVNRRHDEPVNTRSETPIVRPSPDY